MRSSVEVLGRVTAAYVQVHAKGSGALLLRAGIPTPGFGRVASNQYWGTALEPALKPLFDQNPKLGCGLVLLILVAVIIALVQNCSGSRQSDQESNATAAQSAADAKKSEDVRINANAKVEAEVNLKASLKDSDSAEFRNEFTSRLDGGNLLLCGEVNSKNSFGGYGGYSRFIASPNSAAPSVIEGESLSRKAFGRAYETACGNKVMAF